MARRVVTFLPLLLALSLVAGCGEPPARTYDGPQVTFEYPEMLAARAVSTTEGRTIGLLGPNDYALGIHVLPQPKTRQEALKLGWDRLFPAFRQRGVTWSEEEPDEALRGTGAYVYEGTVREYTLGGNVYVVEMLAPQDQDEVRLVVMVHYALPARTQASELTAPVLAGLRVDRSEPGPKTDEVGRDGSQQD
jgi:hypothetical protein